MVESSGLLNRRRAQTLPGVRIPPSPPESITYVVSGSRPSFPKNRFANLLLIRAASGQRTSLLFDRGSQGCVGLLCRLFLHTGQQVAVDIHREADFRVTEALRNNLRMDAGSQ